MRAYIITDNNMGVSAAFTERDELLKQVNLHLTDLEKDDDFIDALNSGGNISISIARYFIETQLCRP